MSNRLDQAREAEFQPKRIEYAVNALIRLGYEITYKDKTRIEFYHDNKKVTFYPYSGWHTGAGIKDGRGIENLLKQLI